MKKRLRAVLVLTVLSGFGGAGLSLESLAFQNAPSKPLNPEHTRFARPVQGLPFQPVLLAFDERKGRLFTSTQGLGSDGSFVMLFRRPENPGNAPEIILDIQGMASGLSYDAEGETLFVVNATKREVNIFDQFNEMGSGAPSRVLRGFNFPTGIGFDRVSKRLFVADAHPGALLVFDGMDIVQGSEPPSQILGPETGLNGPFSVVADRKRVRIYVSNFDGVFAFRLDDLSSPPTRLPLPPGTLARGLAIDPESGRLFIAAPMRRSYFILDGTDLEEIKLQGVSGAFPFSLALDGKDDRLFLAGTEPKIGVIERATSRHLPERGPREKRRAIGRWFLLDDSGSNRPDAPSPFHPAPPMPSPEEGPSVIDFRTAPSHQKDLPFHFSP